MHKSPKSSRQGVSKTISGLAAAKQQQTYTYELSASELPRLAEFGVQIKAPVNVKLRFYQDAGYKPFVELSVNAVLEQACQRCFQPSQESIDTTRTYVLLVSDIQDEQNFAPETEPVVLEEGEWFVVNEVVTDEILLSIETFPLHEPAECDPEMLAYIDQAENQNTPLADHDVDDGQQDDELEKEEKPNPFAALAALKKSNRESED